MGTSKNGAVLKLRSGVGVLLRRGGILWSWGHVGRWLSSPSLRNAQSLSVQSKLTYPPYVLVFLPLCVCVCLGLYVCVLSFYVIAHSPHFRVQPKITCLFCVSMCQTLYVRVNVYKYIYVSVCMFRDLYICVSVTQSSSLCTSTPEAQLPSVCVCVSASVSMRTPARLHTSRVKQPQKMSSNIVLKIFTPNCAV